MGSKESGGCVDVHSELRPAEWRALVGEELRLRGFHRRILLWAVAAAVGALLPVAVTGGTDSPTTAFASWALASIGVFWLGYTVAGPWLSWRRLSEAERTAGWRLGARRVQATRGEQRLDVQWSDVRRVVLGGRVVVLDLGRDHGVLGLPRRALTPSDTAAVLGWVKGAGVPAVSRRTGPRLPG
jgi:hypothetical protein